MLDATTITNAARWHQIDAEAGRVLAMLDVLADYLRTLDTEAHAQSKREAGGPDQSTACVISMKLVGEGRFTNREDRQAALRFRSA